MKTLHSIPTELPKYKGTKQLLFWTITGCSPTCYTEHGSGLTPSSPCVREFFAQPPWTRIVRCNCWYCRQSGRHMFVFNNRYTCNACRAGFCPTPPPPWRT